MKNFRQKLMSFMYGRYGVDELYYGLFGLWLALIIVNMFVRSYIIYLLETAVIIYSLWRMLSKKKTSDTAAARSVTPY